MYLVELWKEHVMYTWCKKGTALPHQQIVPNEGQSEIQGFYDKYIIQYLE